MIVAGSVGRASARIRTIKRQSARIKTVKRSLARIGAVGATALGLGSGPGCSTTAVGATTAQLAHGRDLMPRGAALFGGECTGCHGPRGAGFGDAPAILGPGALPEYPRESGPSGVPGVYDQQQMEIEEHTHRAGAGIRAPLRDAYDLFLLVSAHLSKGRAKAVKDDGFWAIVAFVLAVQGADLPPEGLTPDTAHGVPIPHR